MSLDAPLSDAELLARLAQRTAQRSVRLIEPDDPVVRVIQWPVTLTLPWSYLISDNRRVGVLNGRILLTSDYRRAKGLIRDLARNALGSPPPEPASVPVSLVAAVWVPDNRIHDPVNFAKCCHDALEGVIYRKDCYLYDARWYRAGIDVDQPRAEIVIRRQKRAALSVSVSRA